MAVSDVAVPLGPWVHTPADARLTRLLYRPDPDQATMTMPARGRSPDQLAASIESSDLGRRLLMRIRSEFSLVGRLAAGFGDRRRTRPGRPHRSPFPAIRSALGRPARPRRGHRRIAGRGPAQSCTAEDRALVSGAGGPGPREYRRPRGDVEPGSAAGDRRGLSVFLGKR